MFDLVKDKVLSHVRTGLGDTSGLFIREQGPVGPTIHATGRVRREAPLYRRLTSVNLGGCVRREAPLYRRPTSVNVGVGTVLMCIWNHRRC